MPSHTPPSQNAPAQGELACAYRPEIDGLRAVAILLVVGFHALPTLVPGGFIGVDVFFVISGFLITQLLLRSGPKKTTALRDFYAARVRRIFPSLVVVLLAALAAGWWILFPDEYALLGNLALSSSLFIPNFALMRGAGYFATEAATNPLLHLWSLGIEEQFYLCWPLVILLTRERPQRTKLICWALLGGSLGYSLLMADSNPIRLFYSPLARSWELLVGAALALSSNTARRAASANWAAGLGALLIGLSTILFSKSTSQTPLCIFMPVAGTVLMLWAGSLAPVNAKILSSRLAIALGKISYPFYLWHWVLLAYTAILSSSQTSLATRSCLVIASLLLSWGTYRFVEIPIRFAPFRNSATPFLVTAIAICGLSGSLVSRMKGFPERRAEKERTFLDFFENSSPRFQYLYRADIFRKWRTECAFFNFAPDLAGHPVENRRDSKPIDAIAERCFKRDARYKHAVLLWGDSHAKSLSPGLQRHLPEDWQLLQVSTVECPPSIERQTPSATSQCDQSNYFALKTVRESKPEVVVVAQKEDHSAQTLQQIATSLKGLGVKRVVLVGPVPHWDGELPRILARSRLAMPRRTKERLVMKHHEVNENLRRTLPNDSAQKYADIMALLCDGRGCLTHLGDDVKETITTWDYGHLTPHASEFVAARLLVPLITSSQ